MALNVDLEKSAYSDPGTTCLFKWRMGEGPCQVPHEATGKKCGFIVIRALGRSKGYLCQEGACAQMLDPNAELAALSRNNAESLEAKEDEAIHRIIGLDCE